MVEYAFSAKAYTKIILHAAKYPHLAVNGVLLAKKDSSAAAATQIVDAVPLFHQCVYLAPMSELALSQIDVYAESKGLLIAGYYVAPENFHDYNAGIDNLPGVRIFDKIHEYCRNACFAVVNNKAVTSEQEAPALTVFNGNGSALKSAAYTLEKQTDTLEATSALLKRGAMRELIDFDNYLDNPANDWTNEPFNKDLPKLLAMF